MNIEAETQSEEDQQQVPPNTPESEPTLPELPETGIASESRSETESTPQELVPDKDLDKNEHQFLVPSSEPEPELTEGHSGSDACSDEDPGVAEKLCQTAKEALVAEEALAAEKALAIVVHVSTSRTRLPSSPLSPCPDPHAKTLVSAERVWSPSSTDHSRPNKPKCPPCQRKKKKFNCLGSPPCNECSKRNMTAAQCSSYAPVKPRDRKRMNIDGDETSRKGGKRGRTK